MRVLVINGSPKKKGGASVFFSRILGVMLFSQKVIFKAAGLSRNYDDIFTHLQNTDVVIISAPLYVDGIPSHLIHFLKQMEEYCVNNKCKFVLYVISNAGFIEGRTNRAHLEQYKCWCKRANITWGGGLGIGGTVMLHSIFYIIPLWSVIQFVIGIIINITSGNAAINNGMLTSFSHGMLIWLFFNIGLLFCTFNLAQAIKKKKLIKNRYTRAMLPSLVFLIIADIFMALSALFHGKLIFSLYKKGKM
jgi:multimeric flavodoxin WrbA